MISLVGALPLKRMVWAKCAQSYCLIILLTFRHMVWTFCLSYQNNSERLVLKVLPDLL